MIRHNGLIRQVNVKYRVICHIHELNMLQMIIDNNILDIPVLVTQHPRKNSVGHVRLTPDVWVRFFVSTVSKA